MSYQIAFTDELYHHGIKGQRWGVRRYRNEDGSLTAAGKARYDLKEARKERNKALRKERAYGYRVIGPGKYEKFKRLRNNTNNARINFYNKKADYTDLKSERATKKMYSKAMQKKLLLNSSRRRKAAYVSAVQKKGKTYADNIVKKNRAIRATKFVVTTGAIAYTAYKVKKLANWIVQIDNSLNYSSSLPRLEGTMKVLN